MSVFAWLHAIRDDTRLSPTAKLCAYTLSTYMNRAGECFPSRAMLASGMGMSVASVRRALVEIQRVGAIERVRRFNSSSIYRRVDPQAWAEEYDLPW